MTSLSLGDLREKQELSLRAQQVIEHYKNLKVGEGKTVRTPYYRNPTTGDRKWGLIVFSGKGSPEEIEEELKIIEKLERVDFLELHPESIMNIMRKYRLGVDCAGFAFHVLDALARERKGKSLVSFLKPRPGFFERILWFFRPLTHTNVKLLTNEANASRVDSFQRVLPGDLIVFFDEVVDHVAVVTSVSKDAGGLQELSYAHSVLENGDGQVKEGRVVFSNAGSDDIRLQTWREEPDTGRVLYERRSAPLFFRLRVFNSL